MLRGQSWFFCSSRRAGVTSDVFNSAPSACQGLRGPAPGSRARTGLPGVLLGLLACLSLPVARLNRSGRKSLCTKMLCPQEAEQPQSPSQGAAWGPTCLKPLRRRRICCSHSLPEEAEGVSVCPGPLRCGEQPPTAPLHPEGAPPEQSTGLGGGSCSPLTCLLPPLPHQQRLQAPLGGSQVPPWAVLPAGSAGQREHSRSQKAK